MIKYFNEYLSNDNIIYSCDMLHLNFEIIKDNLSNLCKYFNDIDLIYDNLELKYWQSFKEYTYRHLFNLKTKNCSFVIAVSFNDKRDDVLKGYIEFNPNKCENDSIFVEIKNYLYENISFCEVKRFDLAIDIPAHIDNVFIMKDKRKYQYIKNDTATYYLGTRSHHGFVKLYEKDSVEKLYNDLTRLELTINYGEPIEHIIPDVLIRDYQNSLNDLSALTQNDKVIVELLLCSDNLSYFFNKLNYEKRRKLKPYLNCKKFEFDYSAYHMICKNLKLYMK